MKKKKKFNPGHSPSKMLHSDKMRGKKIFLVLQVSADFIHRCDEIWENENFVSACSGILLWAMTPPFSPFISFQTPLLHMGSLCYLNVRGWLRNSLTQSVGLFI